MHLLHLVEPWSAIRSLKEPRTIGLDAAVDAASRSIGEKSYHTQGILIFGPRGAETRAHLRGLRTFDTICPVNGNVSHGIAAVRRFLAHRPAPDRLIVWNAHLLEIAKGVGIPTIWGWGTQPVAQVGSARTPPLPVAAAETAEVRSRFGAVEGDLLIGLVDDPAHEADLWAFISILAMLEGLGIRAIGIAPEASRQAARGRHAMRGMGLTQGLVLVEEPVWGFCGALDAAVLTQDIGRLDALGFEQDPREREQAAWSHLLAAERLHWCGVPTVSTNMAAAPEAIRNTLTARTTRPADLAGKLVELVQSRETLASVRSQLRSSAPDHAAWLAHSVLRSLTAPAIGMAQEAAAALGAEL